MAMSIRERAQAQIDKMSTPEVHNGHTKPLRNETPRIAARPDERLGGF